MMYQPGDAFSRPLTTQTPATGAAVNADSTPTVAAFRNGALDTGFVPAVSPVSTGLYMVTGTIPAGYADADVVSLVATATVAGVTGKAPLGEPIRLDTSLNLYATFKRSGVVSAVASATQFTVALDTPVTSAAGFQGPPTRYLYWETGPIWSAAFGGAPILTATYVDSTHVRLTFAAGWAGIVPVVGNAFAVL